MRTELAKIDRTSFHNLYTIWKLFLSLYRVCLVSTLIFIVKDDYSRVMGASECLFRETEFRWWVLKRFCMRRLQRFNTGSNIWFILYTYFISNRDSQNLGTPIWWTGHIQLWIEKIVAKKTQYQWSIFVQSLNTTRWYN